MDEHQSIHATAGDHRSGCHCLAESCRRAQHAGVVLQHGFGCRLLVRPQRADERNHQRFARRAFVPQIAADTLIPKELLNCIQATAWQADVLREVLGAPDDSGLVPHRHAHGLRPVELRVLEGGQAHQPVRERLRQLCLRCIDQIGQRHRDRLGHRTSQSLRGRRARLPRLQRVLVGHESHVERVRSTRRSKNRRLDISRRHRLDGCQVRPLIRKCL